MLLKPIFHHQRIYVSETIAPSNSASFFWLSALDLGVSWARVVGVRMMGSQNAEIQLSTRVSEGLGYFWGMDSFVDLSAQEIRWLQSTSAACGV